MSRLIKFICNRSNKTYFVNMIKSDKTILDIAHENNVSLEGACEGSLACSTCHVILEKDVYNSLKDPSTDEEDMLDLAIGLTETSRLGCQIKVSDIEKDEIVITIPSETRNFSVDGFIPKPH